MSSVVLIGYSGHAYVVADCLLAAGYSITHYCEREEKTTNPYKLIFLGKESDSVNYLQKHAVFVAIGANPIRALVIEELSKQQIRFVNAVHPSAIISPLSRIGNGVLVGPSATINSMASIGNGSICNTGSIIEHECQVGDYVHIGPGTVLCGNVTVRQGAFIGANAVVRQGLVIGENAIIGAGAVVVSDVPPQSKFLGNPAKSKT